jgi:drug/metabolite transporter (DMT)-like permease
VGELAALATSILWSVTSIQFTLAGRRIGSEVVNRIRLVLAVALLCLAHLVLYGSLLPLRAGLDRWGWLGLSGLAGLVVGDGCLFQAFLLIGPRRSMLLMTLSPVISALLAWGWFGETPLPFQIVAILVTMGGVAWVVSEGDANQTSSATDRRGMVVGALFGVGGAAGQALGLILSKQGMVGAFPSLSATLMRMVASTVAIWLLALIRGQVGTARKSLQDRRAWLHLVGGVVTGPVLGVWLSMVAVQYAHIGIASTLMSLSPIVLLPLSRWVFSEKITSRAIVGTFVALLGASTLLLT